MKLENYNILIVEDEFIAFEYLKKILLSLGFNNIFKANTANHTLNIIRNNHIDLVFMDINIEGNLDGIQCAKLINKEYFIPIIYTTAYADKDTLNEVKDSDVFGYLIKPFNPQNVEATIKIALKIINKFDSIQKKQTDLNLDFIKLNNNYIYHFKTKTLTFENTPINLTNKELRILDFFCVNINQNISYDTLREHIWSSDKISTSTIRDSISRLKNKITNLNIENITNYGYILKKIEG